MADLSRISVLSVFSLFLIISFTDLFVPSNSHPNSKEIPATKLGVKAYLGPSLKFFYWNLFEQYAALLHQKYPEISVEGELYPPPSHNVLLAKILGAAKMLLIVAIIVGINVFNFFGVEEPSWWTWCINNKIYSCMMLFFLCNVIEGQLISTGAFEISFNDVPVWSKLETGRIPQPPELFQIIDNQLHFGKQMQK